jgi:hypothetical protein
MPLLVDNPVTPSVKEAANISIFDESLLTEHDKKYDLLVTVDHRFIGLSIVDSKERKFYAFEAYHFQQSLSTEQLAQKIAVLPNQSNILKEVDFTNVSVQVVNRNYTFVPSVLYREENIRQYYFLNHSMNSAIEIKADTVRAYDLINVFSVSETILSALKKIFTRFTCRHHLSSLLEAVRMENSRDEHKNISLHFHSGFIDLIVTEGRKLLLCNTFSYKSPEDALYYLLFVCEQLSINTEKITVTIFGELEKGAALHHLFDQYFRNISFSQRPKSATFTYGFDAIPEHFYFSVFSQILNASH